MIIQYIISLSLLIIHPLLVRAFVFIFTYIMSMYKTKYYFLAHSMIISCMMSYYIQDDMFTDALITILIFLLTQIKKHTLLKRSPTYCTLYFLFALCVSYTIIACFGYSLYIHTRYVIYSIISSTLLCYLSLWYILIYHAKKH